MQDSTLDQCSPNSDYGLEEPLTWSDFQQAMRLKKGKHLPFSSEKIEKSESVSPVSIPSKVLCDYLGSAPESQQDKKQKQIFEPRFVSYVIHRQRIFCTSD